MNKDLIKKRFAKNLQTYNKNAKVQNKMAQNLISMLETNEFGHVLEIGCGTGLLTKLVLENIHYSSYTANDIVLECEDYIKSLNSSINFVCGDIEEIIKGSNKHYDLIISNASFQWINDLEDFVSILFEKLNPGGVLLFSTFGKENCKEIYNVLGKTLKYYSVSEFEKMLKSYDFKIVEGLDVLEFETPKDILRHLKLTGVNSLEESSWTKKDMQKFENEYNSFCSSTPKLTYNPIYIMILKSLK